MMHPGALARATGVEGSLDEASLHTAVGALRQEPAKIRLVIANLFSPGRVGPEHWRVELEGGGLLLARTRLPLGEGARALLARGADPNALVTMRHGPSGADCFRPIRLGVAAQMTVSEPADRSAHFRKWRPGPETAGGCGGGGEISAAGGGSARYLAAGVVGGAP
jgi:hypothetical protein